MHQVLGKGRMASIRLVSLDLQTSESMPGFLAWFSHDIGIAFAAYISGIFVFFIFSPSQMQTASEPVKMLGKLVMSKQLGL